MRARLLNVSRKSGTPFNLILTRYALERLLYRLAQSEHRERFVLKGAMLMTIWFNDPLRPTRDIDLLGFGSADPRRMLDVFRGICAMKFDDGVEFDVDSLTIRANRQDLAYGGLRVQTYALVDGAKTRIVIDIGFGDAIEPGIEDLEFPVLLDQPSPRFRTYARETVIAEKFQAMVSIGQPNTRLKDYYDLWVLAQSYAFDRDRLARAIAATFRRRGTEIPIELPDGLKPRFYEDPQKISQWEAFTAEVSSRPGSLRDVVETVSRLLMPAAHAAAAIGTDN